MIHFYGDVKKEKSNYPKTIKQLRETLEQEQPELEQYLLELWDNQQKEITAKQYIEMIQKGKVTKEIEKELLKSYSIFVLGNMLDKKQAVMEKGAKEVKKPLFLFDIKYHETKKWIEKSCAEQIVYLTNMQKQAIKLVIDRAETLGITADGTAKLLKPLIGLHKGQMKEQTAEQKALEKAKQYAKRQKEQRAMNIARTELAGAYNAGEFYGIKQAQKDGLMGNVIKYAISAGDGRVCKGCREVEGQEVKQYDYFVTQWGNVLFPPFHTSCRCAVEYEEISQPEEVTPKISIPIDTQQNNNISAEESDSFFGNFGRDTKGVLIGEKVIQYDKLPKSITEPFEKGLKNAAPLTRTILQREMRNVDYTIKLGYNRHSRILNIISIRKNVPVSTIAHELFHRIDKIYSITEMYDFRKILQKDFDNLLIKCIKDGSIETYLLRRYPTIFEQSKKSTIPNMLEKCRGISDIFSGLTNNKLHFGYRHDKDYWLKDRKNLSKEAWAQYGRITYANDKEVMKVFKELFPNFYEYATIVLKELI